MGNKRSTFLVTALCFGMAFLYIPIILLIVYSFNYSKLVPVWGGFSLRWYGVLFENEQLIEAALLSFQIAFVSASFATVFGTLAALALTRMGRFRGRLLFSGLVAAPLVMPSIITGLSLLLMLWLLFLLVVQLS